MKTSQTPQVGFSQFTPAEEQEVTATTAPTAPVQDTRHITWKTAPPDFAMQCYEDMRMERLVPRFEDFPRGDKVVEAVEDIPNPREVSTTHPNNVAIIFETPGREPTIGWEYYVRGVAAVCMIVRAEYLEPIKTALRDQIAPLALSQQELPKIDGAFSTDIVRCEKIIFCNGEHITWRPMIAFMQGAFWLLSFMNKPDRRRGAYSPHEFVVGLVSHWGNLGMVPL